ncbi:MAG: hypothetical protein JWM65_3532 [Sphingomonas bacterium]|nr:hypothetical protein [Sphingomonas bacterium]
MRLLLRPWRHYVDFRGRSRRLEYGLFLAIFYGVIAGGADLGQAINTAHGVPESRHLPPFIGVPYALFVLAAIVPLVAVTVRRLHDIGVSGWWLTIVFVPMFVGPVRAPGTALIWLLSIVIAFVPRLRRAERYGPDPRRPEGEDEMSLLGDVFS